MTYWVIETARQTYWDGRQIRDDAHFVASIHDAARFADFESAEVIRCWLLEVRGRAPHLRSTEHINIPLVEATEQQLQRERV